MPNYFNKKKQDDDSTNNNKKSYRPTTRSYTSSYDYLSATETVATRRRKDHILPPRDVTVEEFEKKAMALKKAESINATLDELSGKKESADEKPQYESKTVTFRKTTAETISSGVATSVAVASISTAQHSSNKTTVENKQYATYTSTTMGDNPADSSAPVQTSYMEYSRNAEQTSPLETAAFKTNHKLYKRSPLKIIPLGGLNEIGKNMTAFECGNDIFIVDCGLAFPDSDMLGVDMVIPDFSYIEQNADKVKGIIITHGHEDHIGGLAYLLKKVNMPVYATKLTIGLIEGKLREHNLTGSAKLNVVAPRQTIKLGCMAIEFIRVNHSIPDAVALAIHTPAGIVVHTGDFKVDFTPVQGGVIDLARFGELGSRGVLALMSDSTNAERPGHTASERTVGESFTRLFDKAEGKRIIVATFASNIQRIQQIINNAVRNNRKVAVFGRSMLNVISTAQELGYLRVPEGVLIDIDTMNNMPPEEIVLITTGSQGEPMSALTRMAMSEHKNVTITPQDYIIISANPIPGNEKMVTRVVNELMKAGAEVVYESMYEIHVSGHACREELKLMLALTKPAFFIPAHGEYKHLKKHAGLAYEMGMNEENVIIGSIGDVIETDGMNMNITGKVPAGRVLVDGLGVGDVGSIVLRDRKRLSEDGLIIVVATIESESNTILAGPDIISRGFVYVRESEELMDEARELVKNSLLKCLTYGVHDWNGIKSEIRDNLNEFIYAKTKRNPMILPIIEEV